MRGGTSSPVAVTPTILTERPRREFVPNASIVPSGEKAGQKFHTVPSRRPATNLGLPPARTRKTSLPIRWPGPGRNAWPAAGAVE
jgi:hypothetical protein